MVLPKADGTTRSPLSPKGHQSASAPLPSQPPRSARGLRSVPPRPLPGVAGAGVQPAPSLRRVCPFGGSSPAVTPAVTRLRGGRVWGCRSSRPAPPCLPPLPCLGQGFWLAGRVCRSPLLLPGRRRRRGSLRLGGFAPLRLVAAHPPPRSPRWGASPPALGTDPPTPRPGAR